VEGMLSLPNEVSALLRGCIGNNVLIDSKVTEGKLGIVDSIFAPALGAALKSVAPPMCGTEVAGQRVCDPRAVCKLRPSGGVECQCNGKGIEPPAGVRDDGSRCATTPSLKADVAAPAVRVILLKPGHSDQLKFHAIATGDEGLNATFSRGTVLRRDGSAVAQSDDGLHARVFGLAFEWVDPQPTSKASMALDAGKQQYSALVEHAFTLALQCAPNATDGHAGNGTTCPQDGDTIETTIFVTPQAGKVPSVSSTEVRIVTTVQAAVSCERTKPMVRVVANTDLDSVLPAAPLSVHLLAMDMDDQPIRFSRAELVLTWDGVAIPFDWLRGSSEYSWQIPPDRDEGEHQIVVRLKGSDCTLLRLTVTVASDRTQMIVAGCIAGVATLVFALLVWLLFKNGDRTKEFLSSFGSVEGVLTFQIGMEVW